MFGLASPCSRRRSCPSGLRYLEQVKRKAAKNREPGKLPNSLFHYGGSAWESPTMSRPSWPLLRRLPSARWRGLPCPLFRHRVGARLASIPMPVLYIKRTLPLCAHGNPNINITSQYIWLLKMDMIDVILKIIPINSCKCRSSLAKMIKSMMSNYQENRYLDLIRK